ncbi:hypothetical protein BH09GEM1_BH09GEM1_16150 [soil metagenome]
MAGTGVTVREHRTHTARVLIVDDDANNRALVEVMLAPEGYEIVMASSGAEALAIIAEQLPDLILLDVMMPGIDGYQVTARIKADPRTSGVPVIMLTALSDANSTWHGLNAGADGYLTKPIKRADLCARVRQFIRRDTESS